MTDLPQDNQYLSAQVGVLGSVLIDPSHCAGEVLRRTREEDYTGPYRTVYRAIRQLFQASKPVDIIGISHIIGQEYSPLLIQLMDLTPTAANLAEYIRLTLEQSRLAAIQSIAISLASERSLEGAQAAASQLNRILGERNHTRVVNMQEGLLGFYERQQRQADTISWGMDELDERLRAEPGDFIILGGYPSAGKTAFSLQLAWAQAEHRRVGYFSLETNPEKLVDRLMAAICKVDFSRIKAHTLTETDWDVCAIKSEAVRARSLELIQASGLSVVDIQSMALAKRYEVIYIDYLQLIAPEDRRRSDFEQVTQISKDLHTMAATTGVTIVALSQLSRPVKSGEQEKAPGLHSLRQSGQIEQDADSVMLLYKEDPTAIRSRRALKIAKNKEGEAGRVLMLAFDGWVQRFSPSLSQEHEEPKKQAGESSSQGNFWNVPPGENEDIPF